MLGSYAMEPNMINAYKEGKDLYAVIASMAFHNNYEDNLENKDGKLYPEGKARRSSAKSILLGLMYGRGIASIAEQIHGTPEEAQKILDSFYENFPAVKTWMDETYKFVRKYGYVEDFWGRRRRLPDIQLPEYEVIETKNLNNKSSTEDFNPLLGALNIVKKEVNPLIAKYTEEIKKCKGNKQKEQVKSQAKAEGITILDNGGYIAQAERQCINARIQGGSASLTKLAMIKIFNDPKMKEYDAKLIIGVHDELLVEGKAEYAEEIAKQLSYDMITAASENGVVIPMKCDAEIFTWWYQDQIIGDIKKCVKKLREKNESLSLKDACATAMKQDFSFLTDEQYNELLKATIEDFGE